MKPETKTKILSLQAKIINMPFEHKCFNLRKWVFRDGTDIQADGYGNYMTELAQWAHKRSLLASCSVSVVVIHLYSPAQHVNKSSPAVQHVWFGWYWGLGRFPYEWADSVRMKHPHQGIKTKYPSLNVLYAWPLLSVWHPREKRMIRKVVRVITESVPQLSRQYKRRKLMWAFTTFSLVSQISLCD